MTELKWFLKGDTNIRPLLFDNCNIWTGRRLQKVQDTYDYDLDDHFPIEEFVTKIKEDYLFSFMG